jgi:hypothetical protein
MVSINGREEAASQSGFHSIEREWKANDSVELDLPMTWRLVKGRQAQAGRVAVMRGPVVFCLSRARHPELAGADLHLLTLDPSSLTGPIKDDAARPSGVGCKVRAWRPGEWYPFAKPELQLTLTEYPDPSGETVFFHVPDPNAPQFVDDEFCPGP